ncbi:MAG: FkbM family methyltransferase [Nitrososphaeraceae archaeon]
MHERDELTYNKSKTGRFLNVNTKTLDSIVSFYNIDLQKLKWIKIDVEGAELDVLKGEVEKFEDAERHIILNKND